MAKIDFKILNILEELLEMKSGYILDFSNSSFQRFVKGIINVDIYEDKGYEEYCSKANKLRQIFETESNSKVSRLILALVDYYEDYKLKNKKLTEYDKKKIKQLKEAATKLSNQKEENISVYEELDDKIKAISTRNATFNQMVTDEKLKEIGNLIEYLLKDNGKFISLDYETNSAGFLNESIVKELRKKIQCFRHSSKESIIERNSLNERQKEFMIEFGIVICNFIYKELKRRGKI